MEATGPQEYGPRLLLLSAGEDFIYGWGESYDLRVFGRDRVLKRIIRRAWEPVPVREEDLALVPPGWTSADSYPAYEMLRLDSSGDLWVQRGEALSVWDVLDPSGRWTATLPFPEDVQIHDIGEDYILGVWKDESDVPYVRMYALDRSG